MPIGILGRKKFMSRLFAETGEVIPVTYIQCPDNIVTQVKTQAIDGYTAVCLAAFEKKRPSKTKSHYFRKEIRSKDISVQKGAVISLSDLQDVDTVKVISVSKGKGFQGVIKRHNFSLGPATHGSKLHRKAGSVGTRKPTRTVKGLKMAGRMGNDQVTLRSVPIVKIDIENNLIALKGSIPGAKDSFVTLVVNS